ncbi:unnamed protein product, partial [Amoebophrya sp. A25]
SVLPAHPPSGKAGGGGAVGPPVAKVVPDVFKPFTELNSTRLPAKVVAEARLSVATHSEIDSLQTIAREVCEESPGLGPQSPVLYHLASVAATSMAKNEKHAGTLAKFSGRGPANLPTVCHATAGHISPEKVDDTQERSRLFRAVERGLAYYGAAP